MEVLLTGTQSRQRPFVPADPAIQKLFESVAKAGADAARRMKSPPLLFAYVDADGGVGPSNLMDGLSDVAGMQRNLHNKLLGARRMRCRSRDARCVLPGAIERVDGGWKTLVGCGVLQAAACTPLLGGCGAGMVEMLNDRELYTFGNSGAVPVFSPRGDLVCVIGATGGDTTQDESAVDLGMRMAGLV